MAFINLSFWFKKLSTLRLAGQVQQKFHRFYGYVSTIACNRSFQGDMLFCKVNILWYLEFYLKWVLFKMYTTWIEIIVTSISYRKWNRINFCVFNRNRKKANMRSSWNLPDKYNVKYFLYKQYLWESTTTITHFFLTYITGSWRFFLPSWPTYIKTP